MKRISIFRHILLSLFGFIILINFTNSQFIQITKADNADFQTALAKTPKGLNWSNNAFVLAEFQKAAYQRGKEFTPIIDVLNSSAEPSLINNAKIIQSTNPNAPNTSVIQMTNNINQTGAVWSNMENSNYFDIREKQKASMWIYFGSVNPQDRYNADGMAFVLHNDQNKENSIAISADGFPVNGQSLGVWGADWNPQNMDKPEALAKTAIQNSWALEFDTYVNYTKPTSTAQNHEGRAFDYDKIGDIGATAKHIAGNYPALKSTYISDYSFPNFFKLDHGNNYKIRPNLVDSNWHHVTITWDPDINYPSVQKGTLKYVYNDKDPDTGLPITDDVVTASFPLDTTKFGLTDVNNKLYWGFTGSTGSSSENNLIAFESIPSFVGADVDSKIYDDTNGGKEISDSYNTVDPNANIRYQYTLKYNGWSRDWNNINAIMGVPNYVHFTSGTVTYPNSPTNKEPRPIPSELFSDNATNITHLLPEGLNSTNTEAIIDLKGYTEKTATTTLTVPSAHTSFEGDNLITDANTKSFKIHPRLLSLDSSSTDPIKVREKENAIVPGQVTYIGNTTNPNYTSMVVHQTLNGKTTTLGNIINSSGKFNLNIDSSLLDKINTLSFYVTDSSGNTSNTVTRQILVGGSVTFGTVQPSVSFKPTNGSYTDKVLPRLDQWQIDVVDSREKGSQWTVQANATNLINKDKVPLKGNLFYRDHSGKDYNLASNINVANNTKDTDAIETKNITDSWKNNNGILLLMKKGNKAGQYEGTINWSLVDSLQNN